MTCAIEDVTLIISESDALHCPPHPAKQVRLRLSITSVARALRCRFSHIVRGWDTSLKEGSNLALPPGPRGGYQNRGAHHCCRT